MSDQSENPGLELRIDDDAARVHLTIQKTCDEQNLTRELILAMASGRGVTLTTAVEQAADDAIAAFREQQTEIECVLAEAVAAADGEDGQFEWEPKFDPENTDADGESDGAPEEAPEVPDAAETAPTDADDASVDHYNRKSYVAVGAGEVVGTLHEPTEGEDGTNVVGQVLNAKPGKPHSIKFGPTLRVEDDGKVVSDVDGVFQYKHGTLTVDQVLDLPGSVDFSTGNIDFDGNLRVHEGVRDRFIVKATGDITVDGLIEAATISAGGSFFARQGISAKDRGQLLVKGDVTIGYLDNVRGQVGGSLIVTREVIHCQLVIGGSLQCERGSVIGGVLAVTRGIEIAMLGCEAGTATTLILGAVPLLSTQLRKFGPIIKKLTARERDLEKRKMILSNSTRLSALQREQVTEVNYELDEATQQLKAITAREAALKDEMRRTRTIDVKIGKRIFPGARLQIGGEEFQFNREVKGPVKIGWNENRKVQIRQGSDEIKPIETFARPMGKAA